MHLIKLKTKEHDWTYINAGEILSFYYNKQENITIIEMKNQKIYTVNENMLIQLSKTITILSSGNTSTLE